MTRHSQVYYRQVVNPYAAKTTKTAPGLPTAAVKFKVFYPLPNGSLVSFFVSRAEFEIAQTLGLNCK